MLIATTLTFGACNKSTPEAETSTTEPAPEATSASTEEFATTDNKFARMEQVDNALSKLCDDKEFKKANYDKQAELALNVLTDLESRGLIKKDSIIYYDKQKQIAFDYIDGAGGAFMLYEFGGNKYN